MWILMIYGLFVRAQGVAFREWGLGLYGERVVWNQ